MAASAIYLDYLESHATRLLETNARIASTWLERLDTLTGDESSAVAATLHANRTEAELYSQQALWHRHDNGEVVVVRPRCKPWRD